MDIYIYGCGGVGCEIADVLESNERYKIRGFIDGNLSIKECCGYNVVPIAAVSESGKDVNIIISVGEPVVRERLSRQVAGLGYNEITVDLSKFRKAEFVGEGTLLHLDCVISSKSRIGKCCLINKEVLVGHDCTVGDYCVISPRVTMGGFVEIGDKTFIGSGALLRNNIKIGRNCIIGMGSTVISDIEDDMVAVGNPARVIRKNESGKIFKRK